MMRMLVGIVLRMSEMITLAKASTAITEMPMTMAGSSLAVTASTEQMPSTCTTTGLFFDRGLKSTSVFLIFSAILLGEGYWLRALPAVRESDMRNLR